jgi:hypothetical protein
MDKPKFPGSFLLHPAFIVSMIAVMINNLWFKTSGISPLLAGKITDVGSMIYLPALICLGIVFIRDVLDLTESHFKREKATHYKSERYIPSRVAIVVSIIISAMLMILVKVSDMGIIIYTVVIGYLNDVLFNGRTIAKPVKDMTDLFSLLFLLIPYIVLRRYNEEGSKSDSAR